MPRPQVPWSRVLAEGLVVVVSILLALATDAWWSHRAAQATAMAELQAVLFELDGARTEFNRVGRMHATVPSLAQVLRMQLDSSPLGQEISVPDTMLVALLAVPVAEPPAARVSAFTSSESFGEVHDAAVQATLLGWLSTLEDMRDDELEARSFQNEVVIPHLVPEADITRRTTG